MSQLAAAVILSSCACIASAIASYALFALSEKRVSSLPLALALASLSFATLSRLVSNAEMLEVLGIAYPVGIGFSLAIAFARAKLVLRNAEVVAEVDGIPIYLCSCRGAAFTFYPLRKVFLSRYLATLLNPMEIEAVALHEYGHQVDSYRVINLVIAAVATLCISASALDALANYCFSSLALLALCVYASLVTLKSSTWIFEHVADLHAARRGRALELCTSLAKVYACSRLGKLCLYRAVEPFGDPRVAIAIASSFSLPRALLSLLSPKPSLHPPLEARLALVLRAAGELRV